MYLRSGDLTRFYYAKPEKGWRFISCTSSEQVSRVSVKVRVRVRVGVRDRLSVRDRVRDMVRVVSSSQREKNAQNEW